MFTQEPSGRSGEGEQSAVQALIDVRGISEKERVKRVSQKLEPLEIGALAEILADDERMLKLAPKVVNAIGKAELIRSWKGEDGYYHTLVRRS